MERMVLSGIMNDIIDIQKTIERLAPHTLTETLVYNFSLPNASDLGALQEYTLSDQFDSLIHTFEDHLSNITKL